MPKIISWNICGGSMAKLSEAYSDILSSRNDNIILIQEAGSIVAEKGRRFQQNFGSSAREGHIFSASFYEQRNAKNPRCTTGMMVENGFTNLQFKCLYNSGERPIVVCECAYTYSDDNVQNFVIATVHSTANEHPAKKELLEINEIFRNNYGDDISWLVMGDFNCDGKISDFKGKINISCPNRPTHESGKTLDFAICSDNMKERISVRICSNSYGHIPLTSDHFPIYCEF